MPSSDNEADELMNLLQGINYNEILQYISEPCISFLELFTKFTYKNNCNFNIQ